MPGPKAASIRLTRKQQRKLERFVSSRKAESGLVQRIRIVLMAAGGATNAEIARGVGCTVKTASKWRTRFARSRQKKAAVLRDASRSGRPSTIPRWVRLELIKLACDRPVKHKQRFRDVWTLATLRTALERETGFALSLTEIRRVLRVEQLRPHHIKLWLHSPDPDFRRKVRAICDEYLRLPGPGETVVCVDEKTGMQALEHKHPLEPPLGGASSSTFAMAQGRCSQPSTLTPVSCSAAAPSGASSTTSCVSWKGSLGTTPADASP